MKKLFYFLAILLFFSQCKKEDDNDQTEQYVKPYMLAGQKTGEGIRYVNINPDYQLCGYCTIPYSCTTVEYQIDINNDGTKDFKFETHGCMSPELIIYDHKIIPLHNNEICELPDSANSADTLSLNDTIDNHLAWHHETSVLYAYDSSSTTKTEGIWNELENYYVGLKVVKGTDIFYGWARFKINKGWITIMEYAGIVPITKIKL